LDGIANTASADLSQPTRLCLWGYLRGVLAS